MRIRTRIRKGESGKESKIFRYKRQESPHVFERVKTGLFRVAGKRKQETFKEIEKAEAGNFSGAQKMKIGNAFRKVGNTLVWKRARKRETSRVTEQETSKRNRNAEAGNFLGRRENGMLYLLRKCGNGNI